MNVIFLAQDRVFNGGEEDEGTEDMHIGPAVSPSVKSAVCAMVNLVANTFIREKKTKKEVNGRKTIIKRMQYCLGIGPSALYVRKFRKDKEVALPDFIVDPSYDAINETLPRRWHCCTGSRRQKRLTGIASGVSLSLCVALKSKATMLHSRKGASTVLKKTRSTTMKKRKTEESPEDLGIYPAADFETGDTALIYGRSGTGKTTLFATWPKPALLLNISDDGIGSVKKIKGLDVVDVKDLDHLDRIYNKLRDGKHSYKTVGIDTITKLLVS